MTGEQNLIMIRQIEEHREFLLTILSQNPGLLTQAEPGIRALLQPLPAPMRGSDAGSVKPPA